MVIWLGSGCAHGDKDPDSNPPFVIVAAGQVEVVLELELEEIRVENEDGAAEEIGRIEEDSAEEENNVLLGRSEVVDELWISLVEAAEVVGSTEFGIVLDSEAIVEENSEVVEAKEIEDSTLLVGTTLVRAVSEVDIALDEIDGSTLVGTPLEDIEETADEPVKMLEEVSEIAEVLTAPLDETIPLEDAIIEDATFEDTALEDPTFEVVAGTSEDRRILELTVAG
ncbi:uncharacterized protein EAF01_001292 [Botrytis porri]|uniref:uncharacterized protein n=1 Tax=Botrytis porri TaxID=87229 RepID=UPI001901693D|nr:uncharacterized protein EAF01_001292 [Botrytis porri]KAF7912271.1 hypothetical protein EAF01_001292 [Botrytis porri]